ncbi:hypothetical protein B5M09_007113 [Aphanomyces astaci]|uniref:FYVE-type domain-containing protein n=1 Tax=Aphanomyces astaci TaxID=112090 RepID=A0A425CX36_APHAT|nr:hypothetical protein B5M09_007113 [Aphanomyces astaci]
MPSSQLPLPLPTNFFHTKALDARSQQSLLHTAQSCGAHLLRNAHAMDDHLVYAMHTDPASHRRMKMVLGKDTLDLSLTCMIGHTQFHASLEDVAAFFRSDSLGCAANDGLELDSRHLYTLAAPTKDDPLRYTGVHWTAYKMPPPSTSPRDYCYLEGHSEFTDPKTSRRGWFRVLQSVDVAACPSLLAPCGILRSHWFRSGHVFMESGRHGLLDCYAVLAVAPGDHNQHHGMSFMRKWITQVMAVPNAFLTRRLATAPLLPDDALRPKDSVKMCMVCTSRFNLFNSKHHCRLCGQVVCGNCHLSWKVRNTKVRMCVQCTDRGGVTSFRDSCSMTWTSSLDDPRRRGGPSSNQHSSLNQRESFASSADATATSSCSDDQHLVLGDLDCLGSFTVEGAKQLNYDHLFDFSVLLHTHPLNDTTTTNQVNAAAAHPPFRLKPTALYPSNGGYSYGYNDGGGYTFLPIRWGYSYKGCYNFGCN